MHSKTVYPFSDSVKSACVVMGVLCAITVMGIPLAIYLFIKRNSAQLSIDATGFEVNGLAPSPTRWDYSDLQRIGLLEISVPGGGLAGAIARNLSGGQRAVNLCGITRSGRKPKFMLSRFRDHEAILTRIVTESGLPMETLGQGALGPKWP